MSADKITAEKLVALYEKQGGRCALTGQELSLDNMSLDHIVPHVHRLSNDHDAVPSGNAMNDKSQDDSPLLARCKEIVDKTESDRKWVESVAANLLDHCEHTGSQQEAFALLADDLHREWTVYDSLDAKFEAMAADARQRWFHKNESTLEAKP